MNDTTLVPEAVSVATARQMLGGIANHTIYDLINSGDLRSFRVARRRLVSLDAIREYIKSAERKTKTAPKRSANQI